MAHAVSPLYAADVASGRKSFGESTLNETGSAAAAGNIHVSVMPNWLPHHLPNLVLLSPATAAAMSGIGFGLGMHMAGGPPVLPLPQIVVDLVASLRRCDTINKLIEAVIVGLQDLTHRATSMHFCATPMLLHRSAVSAAIFHDFGPREGNNTRGDLERYGLLGLQWDVEQTLNDGRCMACVASGQRLWDMCTWEAYVGLERTLSSSSLGRKERAT